MVSMEAVPTRTDTFVLGLIPLLPLLAAVFNVFFGERLGRRNAGILACSAVGASFLLSLWVLTLLDPGVSLKNVVYAWIESGTFKVNLSFQVDALSIIMLVVVTGIGFLIHVYSLGYMAHDDGMVRYFAYLNLFIFFMLLLVMADNLLVLFVGWEGVGLCSFLLIGFWTQDHTNTIAGNKAFIVNRIGDFGFLLGILLLFWEMGRQGVWTLDFSVLERNAHALPPEVVTVITLLLFAGATGKSAQIPLFVWLPDAMQGPTPVSALIHAATMVTAGVYMTARLHFLFTAAPFTLDVIATIGVLTAFFAGAIALAQNDIKRVLAYSTVSQLGYMFLAVGLGAFSAAVFHLFTHAFFKACLFLSAGSLIHGLDGEQDMRKMGGLKLYFPVTYWTYLVAALAISGAPFTAGFFSKDQILWLAFESPRGSFWLWLIAWLTAGLTAFYMFRQFFMVFHGPPRFPETHRIHESPPVMTWPLTGLALGSLFAGWIGTPEFMWGSPWNDWLDPFFGVTGESMHESVATELFFMALTLAIAAIGIYSAFLIYGAGGKEPAWLSAWKRGKPYELLFNKFYIDEIYDFLLVRPLTRVADWLAKAVDVRLIDGAINGVAQGAWDTSVSWRRLQSGHVQHYLFGFLAGAVLIVGYYFF
jgi:NADH-quinone oxidoreductase subunit L